MRSPFLALADEWLTWLQHNQGRSIATVNQYLSTLERLQRWCLSPPAEPHLQPSTKDPMELKRADIDLFAGLVAHSQGLAPRSRRVLVSALRGFYGWTAAEGRIATNLAERLPYPKAGKALPRPISLENAEKLLMAPDVSTFLGLRDAAIIISLAGLGCRVSGLIGLNEGDLLWQDVDGHEDLYVRLTEKGGRERLVPAPHEMALLLRAYLGHPELALIDRTLEDGDRVLWVTTRNRQVVECDYRGEQRRISDDSVRDLLLRHGKRAGVPPADCHPHAFRHLYGTELAESDVSLLSSQALLGHEDPKSTEIYTRLAVRKLRAGVDRGNPLAKMRTPLLDDLRALAAAGAAKHARSRPAGRHKSKSPGPLPPETRGS